jgi:hypothetical protein
MQKTKKLKLILTKNLLICSLLTLEPQNKLFTIHNIKEKIHLNYTDQNRNLNLVNLANKANLHGIYMQLNQPTIRQLAYHNIKPFLIGNLQEDLLSNQNNRQKIQILRLQKYLKKFRYLYKRYFSASGTNFDYVTKDKELNYFALQILFWIVGI